MTNAPGSNVRNDKPIWQQFYLIETFANRNLKTRFKGSALGWMWSLLVPLATLAIYTAVFSLIFRAEPPDMGHDRPGIFVLFLFCGLTFWTFFSGSITGAMGELMSAGSILQKVYFPAYAPVLGSVWAVGTQSAIEVGILAAVMVVLGNVGISWVAIPVWMVLAVTFTSALAVTVSILNVYFRDLSHLISVILQLLFYLTPIIYPMSMVTAVPPLLGRYSLADLLYLNPLTSFVQLFRSLIYELNFGTPLQWGAAVSWTAIALLLAVFVSKRRGADLGENI